MRKYRNLSLDNPARLLYNTKAVKKKLYREARGDAAPGLETTMAKDLHITFLLAFYGDMLTDKQREVVECYYNEDLSLAEIAEVKGITRQGVRDAIKRAELRFLKWRSGSALQSLPQGAGGLTSICDRALQIEAQNEKNGGDPVIRQNVEAILASAKGTGRLSAVSAGKDLPWRLKVLPTSSAMRLKTEKQGQAQ